MGIDVTSVPGADETVSGPISSTSAENSWPMKTSWSRSIAGPTPSALTPPISSVRASMSAPCLAKWRSLPQMPQAFTCTSTCPNPGTGSGASSFT
jgi:hypothetical protein